MIKERRYISWEKILTRKKLTDINFTGLSEGIIRASAISPRIGQFRWDHTKRVAAIAMQLSESEKVDIRKLEICCICHDMYKYLATDIDHGTMAANWLKDLYTQWSKQEGMTKLEMQEWEKVIKAIEKHSEKSQLEVIKRMRTGVY